MENEVIKIS